MSAATRRPAWVPTNAASRAVLICAALIIVGVLVGRADLVVVAAPFAIGTAWSLRRRPTQPPVVAVELDDTETTETAKVQVGLLLSNVDNVELLAVVGRLTTSAWLESPKGPRSYATDAPPNVESRRELHSTATHWGRQDVGPAVAYGVACDGLMISSMVAAPALQVSVYPAVAPFSADEIMPRSSALVGVHRSRRPGEGGELAGVRQYGPGDRLRRIDWRVTLRTSQLHVAQMLSDRDAEVVILLDVFHEAGDSGGVNGAASVVDTTVRAAAAITEYYIRQGDRVGLIEYSGAARRLRIASGRRHLRTALDWLLETRAAVGAGDRRPFSIDPSMIPNSALVVVLTPLLGPQSAEVLATLARAGRAVVAVDTLGSLALRQVSTSRWNEVAVRLWRLERENLIGLLREAGVPVTPWAGTGSLDQVLRDTARMASAPRLGGR